MWPRFLRRHILYLTLALLALVYLLSSLFKHGGLRNLRIRDSAVVRRTRPLIWRTLQEHVLPDEPSNYTNSPTLQCRNTVQGRTLLTDERGFTCPREDVLPGGCCNVEIPETEYYNCQSCNNQTHCCDVYEYCVACCLHPSKRPLLEEVLRIITGRQAVVYAAVEDHFELCLVKCRTNSHSVEHENKYRDDGKPKYCYGVTTAHESQLEVSGSAAVN